ncbi:phage tail protein [Pasteurella bettyae]|uniref:p2 phage tail completion protein R (GpR) n=1 Tax=Pasteurella bettyae CCUG 2042 TaxID=1095749 RepID=I3DCH3_9PAST|nr:phage tail protein [Pasteurella bettyae]EIJ69416.1 P2 phage tail completion protein R (GpR) [Pasteurella bettyae CCUG 2042]SUB20759.1 P2 phage tail completion protein R (GpR) [Pasteurella bettyae]SUB21319.1 P2 phage tail completion protein R (GpR) [Pasteurella bettyae]
MKKLNQIRNVFEKSNPFFVKNPDKLQLWIDDGKVIRTGTENLSFYFEYKLNIVVTDYPEDIATLTVPILSYLQINQPELFQNTNLRESAVKFTPDFNNNNTADIHFEISHMTERVLVTDKKDDSVIIDYKPEPVWDNERVRVYFESWDEENLVFDSEKTK